MIPILAHSNVYRHGQLRLSPCIKVPEAWIGPVGSFKMHSWPHQYDIWPRWALPHETLSFVRSKVEVELRERELVSKQAFGLSNSSRLSFEWLRAQNKAALEPDEIVSSRSYERFATAENETLGERRSTAPRRSRATLLRVDDSGLGDLNG